MTPKLIGRFNFLQISHHFQFKFSADVHKIHQTEASTSFKLDLCTSHLQHLKLKFITRNCILFIAFGLKHDSSDEKKISTHDHEHDTVIISQDFICN